MVSSSSEASPKPLSCVPTITTVSGANYPVVSGPADGPTTRRRLLEFLGISGVLTTAGCLGGGGSGSTPQEDEDSPTTTESSAVRQWARQADPEGPVRADGDVVSIEDTRTDEPGYEEDGFEYFPENRTVRTVATTSGGEPTSFSTKPFNEWGDIESAEVGATRAAAVTARRLEVDFIANGIGQAPAGAASDEFAIKLEVSKTIGSEGEVESWPVATFPALKQAAPRSVEVTLSVEGDTVSRTVPVYVKYIILKEM